MIKALVLGLCGILNVLVLAGPSPAVGQNSVDLIMTSVSGPCEAIVGKDLTTLNKKSGEIWNGVRDLQPRINSILVSTRVLNQGTTDSGSFRIGIYLSEDDVVTVEDVFLGSREIAALGVGEANSGIARVSIPPDTPEGSYTLGAVADDREDVAESDESNNALADPEPILVRKAFPRVARMQVIENDAGRVDWSHCNNLIAFDKVGEDGYCDVWTMNPDGSNKLCLTEGQILLPGKHMGQPVWHPSGEWIVFQAEKRWHPYPSAVCTPGLGRNNDLWIIRSDGTDYRRLTQIDVGLSTLHPLFSHDGAKLLWCESRDGIADWVIKIADFNKYEVQLENEQTLRPGNPSNPVFYETHGFSPDDSKIIFSANLEPGQHWTGIDIYTYTLDTQELQPLTSTFVEWDEHAHYSPDGQWVVWMSSRGNAFNPVTLEGLRTDFWITRADGSCQKRLTYFNKPGHPEFTGEQITCGDFSWGPDGRRLAAYVFPHDRKDHGRIIILHMNETAGGWNQDENCRTIIRRGFVTITNNSDYPYSVLGDPLDYTLTNYERQRSWGANTQVVRIGATQIGAWPGADADPFYLQRLDQMVALARQVGISTIFKLTFYDVPGEGLGPDDDDWRALWENADGRQEKVLDGWRGVWERFLDEPAVIGYDLLNEGHKGSLPVDDETFIAQYLTPFYRELIDALQAIDPNRLALFQPPIASDPVTSLYASYNTPIGRTGVVYAPHFHTNLNGFDTSNYEPEMQKFADEANDVHGCPLFIGEHGGPILTDGVPLMNPYTGVIIDDDLDLQASYQATEEARAMLFEQFAVGAVRPWFADDRAAWGSFNSALIQGTDGLDGTERSFIVDVLARPFPMIVAGVLHSFEFDPDTSRFTMTFTPDIFSGSSEIFVPRQRHYPDGFRVWYSPGITLECDPLSPTGLRVVDNPGNLDPDDFGWDETRSCVIFLRWHISQGDHSILIGPAGE